MNLRDATGSLTLVPVRRRPGGWALIELSVAMARGSWTTYDECLERRDVRDLIRWLREIARGRMPKELAFTEPNLRFECLTNDELARIRVWFELEARPSWAPSDKVPMDDLWLDLDVSRDDVAAASDVLAGELAAIEE